MPMPRQGAVPVPTTLNRGIKRIAAVAVILFVFLVIANVAAASDPYVVFKPIQARSDSPPSKWMALGVSPEAARAFHDYATDPDGGTAIGALAYYNELAGDPQQAAKARATREALFAADKQLFQSLDAMKYEIVMRTQKRLSSRFADEGGVALGLRVGSSAKRHKQWLEWARGGKDMSAMPELDPNKQFSSDDDITNFPRAGAEEANPVLAEKLNGQTAADEFVKATQDLGYKQGMDPKLVQVEFLSPTKAFDILRTQHPGEFKATTPNFMGEWTRSDQEKYNGLFAVEQLHQWAMDKGMVTTNIDDPIGTTRDFSHYANTAGDPNAPKGFSPEGLFGWMANNHRQIFHVHGGDLKSLAKYTSRMIAAYRVLGVKLPQGDDRMYDMAVKIYNPPDGHKPPADALDSLMAYNRSLIREAHKQNMQLIAGRLADAIRANSASRPIARGLNFVPFELDTLMAQDPDLRRAVNALAVGYTNIDNPMIRELELEIGEQIRKADMNMKQVKPVDGYTAHMATYMLKVVETAKQAAAASRAHADAFTYLRNDLAKRINEHVTDINKRLNLDTYLLRVTDSKVRSKELRIRWDGKRPVIAERILEPADVATDMRRLEMMCKLFFWEEAPLATRAREYFEADDPDLAVRMVTLLREMGDVAHAKPVVITYTDGDGKQITQVVKASVYQAGLNAGFLAFKGALKGWKIWGDVTDGRDLYLNLKKITMQAGLEPAELAQAQAQALTKFLGLLEYFQAGKFTHNVPAGSTLATLATLAGNSFQDDNVYTELGIALFKDLAVAYQPYLIYAYALHGITSWGYNKYSLSVSKDDIITLLVENGKWDIDDMKEEDKKRVKNPKLLGYTVWDGKDVAYLEKDVLKLAKHLPEKAAGGIMLKKSKRLVNPRESLMDIAYRSGYIDKDPLIDVDVKAINDLFSISMIKLPIMLTNIPVISWGSREWTKEWLESSYGVLVPTEDDDTKVRKKFITRNKKKIGRYLVQVGTGEAEGWGTWAATLAEDVQYGMLKNMGVIIQDFWVKRQLLLEKVVWPEILKEAAKLKMKDDIQQADASDLLDELKKLKERMKALDQKVWETEVARSTDPFTGPLYDPKTDTPITDHWWKKIEPQRIDLGKYVVWLKKNKDNPKADPAPDFPPDFLTQVGSYLGQSIVVQSKKDVETLAKDTIAKITDKLIEYEKSYEATLKVFDDTRKLIKKLGKFDLGPCHVKLDPAADKSWYNWDSTPEADTKIAEAWRDQWKQQKQDVNFDIGSVLLNMGFKPPEMGVGLDTIEKFQAWLTGRGADVDIASSHPLWDDLMQLKMQIHKLNLLLTNIQEVSGKELTTAVSGMIIKEVTEVEKKDAANNVLKEEELKDLSVDVGSPPSPAEREKVIRELIRKMEDNYITLLALVRQLFNLEIDVSPASGHYLAQEIEVAVTVTPRKFGPSAAEIEKILKNFRYEIHGLEPQVSEGAVIVDEIVKEKTWKHHLSAAGKQKIRVQALGTGHMPFSVIEQELSADSAHLKGELVVHGDFTGDPPFTLKFGRDILIHDMGILTAEGAFDIEIKRLNDNVFKTGKDATVIKPFISFGKIFTRATMSMTRTYGLAQMPLVSSNRVNVSLAQNLFTLDAPLEVVMPATVNIDVTVNDSSDTPVTAEITAGSKDQSISTPDPLVLRLMNQDPVWVMAEREDVQVSAKSKPVKYDDPTMQGTMAFTPKLPFFDAENLGVKGRFDPVPGLDPAPTLTGGQVRSSLSPAQAVGADGGFTFTNERPVPLSETLTIYGLLYSDDDRMFKPKGGAHTTPLKEGRVLDLGSIPVEPYEVKIDPITIRVTDQTGKPVPETDLKVTIGPDSATWNGSAFVGTWTISRKNQQVELKAVYTLPDGTTVDAAETLSASQFDLLGNPKPPKPIVLRLPVHMSLTIEGVSAISPPTVPHKPEKIKVGCPDPAATGWFDLGGPFTLNLTGPVRVGATLTIEGKAKPVTGNVQYEGSVPAQVRNSALIQVGTLTVKSGKGSDFLVISGMTVTGPSGSGPPTMGQPMKGTATVTVGKYEGPLPVVEWKRMSDMNTDRQFQAHVTPGQSFTVITDMPAPPKGARLKNDVLELRISDDIDQEAIANTPFTWEMGDEFSRFVFTSVKKGKTGHSFKVGEQIGVASRWRIAKENGRNRTIVYAANGTEFAREGVRVTEGARFDHSAVLDTKGMSSGMTDIRAELINTDPATTAIGDGKLNLKESRDEIVAAGAAATNQGSGGRKFTQGDTLHVNAEIRAAEGKEGLRTLNLEHLGKTVRSVSFEMTGAGDTVFKSFPINTGKLRPRNHVFTLKLFDADGSRQDKEIVRFKLAKKKKKPDAGQGGLQNVSCTGDMVSIKIWDHGAQDGDIITLRMGGRVIRQGFNLNACGGSEPGAGPCAFLNLPLPPGSEVAISITAHNEGSSSPNTAALKVEGGCTPELQHWSLKTGGSAAIVVSRDTSTQQGTGQGGTGGQSTGQPANAQTGGQSAVQSAQPWP